MAKIGDDTELPVGRPPDRDRRCCIASGASNVTPWSLRPAGTRTDVTKVQEQAPCQNS